MTEDEVVGWHHRLNGRSKPQETVKCREAACAAGHGMRRDLVTEQQQNKIGFFSKKEGQKRCWISN